MSFRRIYDAMTRGPLIVEAFGKVEDMHDLTRDNFQNACECFIGKDTASCASSISAEDKKINKMEMEIRKQVFEYLAVSSTPNVNASLILVSTVIDYERIGDLSKNISQLPILFPCEIEEDEYIQQAKKMRNNIIEIFNLTKAAVRDGDLEKAQRAIRLHDENKEIHNQILEKLNEDASLSAKKGIIYALLSYYLRRINGHLGNISSTAINSFPKMGFTGNMKDLDE